MKLLSEVWLCIFGTLLSILLRLGVTLHSHSGEAKPPMFGDYEAQRHWMEITVNLPLDEWYQNTTRNDLQYWGLDYPPLTAYHMFFCGKIAELINADYTTLHNSRGYESDSHKLFMRSSVLVADLLIYIPALVLYFLVNKRVSFSNQDVCEKKPRNKKSTTTTKNNYQTSYALLLALIYPGIILIDHGHFQYNCISLGLFIIATSFITIKRHLLASIFFVLALNYKQMELYHALPFFLHLLSACIPKPGESIAPAILRLVKIGITVTVTFAVIWAPFLSNPNDFLQVLHRLFPLARGVFEDKVSNVWCALNVFYKIHKYMDTGKIVKYCLVATLAAVLPSSADLFLRPNVKKFVPALINSSLGFFLFSFQVHEKSVLLCAIPVLLYLPNDPFACFWFLYISTFSMLPLLVKDGLTISYFSLMVLFVLVARFCYNNCFKNIKSDSTLYSYYRGVLSVIKTYSWNMKLYNQLVDITSKHLITNTDVIKSLFLYLSLSASIFGTIVLSLLFLTISPPDKYPDFYPLLISVYSCLHFIGFGVYFNVVQLKIPQTFDDVRIKYKTQ